MTLIQLTGKINDQGQLELDLPKGLPTGEVEITLEILDIKESGASYRMVIQYASLLSNNLAQKPY